MLSMTLSWGVLLGVLSSALVAAAVGWRATRRIHVRTAPLL
jgi:hypothetical protein